MEESKNVRQNETSLHAGQTSFSSLIIRYFISGTIVVLPLVVTVSIVLWLSNFFITWFGPSTKFGTLLSLVGIRFVKESTVAYVFGWMVVLALLFLIGFFAEVVIRKTVIKWFDSVIQRIPLVGMIYGTTRKFTNLMDTSKSDELHSMSPVYCRFGAKDGGVLILALMPSEEEYEIEGNQYRVVIIPTAPVPFGGGMFFIPSSDVFPAKMSIDALMSFYVSMGVSGNQQA